MKKIIKIISGLLLVGTIVLYITSCEKEDITKEQQNNIVKRIARSYDIKSIEFIDFKKDINTGSYVLRYRINEDDKYKTGISFSDKERLNNYTDEIGLSPIDNFEKLKRKENISLEEVDENNIKVKYIGE